MINTDIDSSRSIYIGLKNKKVFGEPLVFETMDSKGYEKNNSINSDQSLID